MKLLTIGLLLSVTPVLAQAPAPGAPSCHGCTFSDYLDLSINTDYGLTATSQDSCCEPYLLGVLVPAGEAKEVAPSAADEGGQSFLLSKAIGWSAWSTRLGLLSWYLPHTAHPGLADTEPLATHLPSADGRLLYLVGGDATEWPLLIEFRGYSFRYLQLGYDARANIRPQLYHHPDADLLVLTITDGAISKIYNTETTWLSVLDLRRDRWLLDTVVESWSDDEEDGHLTRRYQVRDRGRTLVLGAYRDTHQKYLYATLPHAKNVPQARHDLPPGTYQLLAGRYQLAKAATPPAAPVPTHRPAISAAEANGTYRDAQGRELAVLAQGGGRVRVAFRGAVLHPHGLLYRHVVSGEGTIAADTAAIDLLRQPEACTLRLHFEQPGTLRVREHGPGCLAEAVGTYQKVSAEKPVIH